MVTDDKKWHYLVVKNIINLNLMKNEKVNLESMHKFEYMDIWLTFIKTSFTYQENFCSSINLEDISNSAYKYARKV